MRMKTWVDGEWRRGWVKDNNADEQGMDMWMSGEWTLVLHYY